mgnify:CR=1 FL=1
MIGPNEWVAVRVSLRLKMVAADASVAFKGRFIQEMHEAMRVDAVDRRFRFVSLSPAGTQFSAVAFDIVPKLSQLHPTPIEAKPKAKDLLMRLLAGFPSSGVQPVDGVVPNWSVAIYTQLIDLNTLPTYSAFTMRLCPNIDSQVHEDCERDQLPPGDVTGRMTAEQLFWLEIILSVIACISCVAGTWLLCARWLRRRRLGRHRFVQLEMNDVDGNAVTAASAIEDQAHSAAEQAEQQPACSNKWANQMKTKCSGDQRLSLLNTAHVTASNARSDTTSEVHPVQLAQ